MIKLKTLLLVLFSLIVTSFAVHAQTARLQVIHNAADPAAEVVDIYLDGSILLDDFAFRAATPFIDAPANQEIEIGVAPGTSSSANDIIATFKFNLSAGEKYVAIANGVLDPTKFATNPDGKDIGFTIFVKPMAREMGTDNNVDFFILHGSTDAPPVDVVVKDGPTLAEGIAYGEMTDYISVPPNLYVVILNSQGRYLIGFDVDLSNLGGGSAVVLASGFVNPADNQNGEGFALIGILPNGLVVNFPDPPLSVGEFVDSTVPATFELQQNYPNPFNPTTTISFSIPNVEFVRLKVFNMLGQEVASVLNKQINAGRHQVIFDASNLISGVYYYQIEAGNYLATKRMVLMK